MTFSPIMDVVKFHFSFYRTTWHMRILPFVLPLIPKAWYLLRMAAVIISETSRKPKRCIMAVLGRYNSLLCGHRIWSYGKWRIQYYLLLVYNIFFQISTPAYAFYTVRTRTASVTCVLYRNWLIRTETARVSSTSST